MWRSTLPHFQKDQQRSLDPSANSVRVRSVQWKATSAKWSEAFSNHFRRAAFPIWNSILNCYFISIISFFFSLFFILLFMFLSFHVLILHFNLFLWRQLSHAGRNWLNRFNWFNWWTFGGIGWSWPFFQTTLIGLIDENIQMIEIDWICEIGKWFELVTLIELNDHWWKLAGLVKPIELEHVGNRLKLEG